MHFNLMLLLTTITITHSYKPHKPVLLSESINTLVTNRHGRYVDGTLGSGGHSKAIISSLTDQGSLICVDRDPEAIKFAQNLSEDRVTILLGNFGQLESLLSTHSLPTTGYSGILLDLGVSTHQLEEPNRGFSYKKNGILDMRMSNPLFDSNSNFGNTYSCNTAQYIVNNWPEERLYNLFRELGEEPSSATIARSIVYYRKIKPITTTYDLKSAILKGLSGNVPFDTDISKQYIDSNKYNTYKSLRNNELDVCGSIQDSEVSELDTWVIGKDTKVANRHDYTTLSRIFQSLRMVVNDELYFLEQFLLACPALVGVNGRIVIISYHSLEDRMVKHAFKNLSVPQNGPNWKIVTKKCITPSASEVSDNPRSRSAKMRCIERVS